MQANSSASSELTALQRLAAAGSEPLLAVGRALGAHLVHSLGSTTSVAITGGLGLIRLGLGAPPPPPPTPYTPCLCCRATCNPTCKLRVMLMHYAKTLLLQSAWKSGHGRVLPC